MKWVRIGVIIFLMLLFGRPNVYAKESAVPIACQGQDTNICIYTIEDLNSDSKNIQKGFIEKGKQSKFITKHKKPGTYSYRIRQKPGTDPNMEYDKSSHIVDTKIATQAHSFRCGLVAQQYKLFNKLNYIFNFTMEIFTYAV